MVIGALEVKLKAPWVHSLKEKRMIIRSLVAKIRQKFNVSVHEVAAMDHLQTIVLGITTCSNSKVKVQSVLDHVVNFIEENHDLMVEGVTTQFY